jgi:hypothetical protein
MPSARQNTGEDSASDGIEAGGVAVPQESRLGKLFESADDVEQYKRWKQEIPACMRTLIEGALLGRKTRIDSALPPLTRQFLKAVEQLLMQPERDCAEMSDIDPRVLRVLQPLQAEHIDDAQVNVFRILASKESGFSLKAKWYEARLAPRFQWALAQDQEAAMSEAELITVDDDQKIVPTMDEMQESKEGVNEGEYIVHPAYGGYYRGRVCEEWDAAALEWRSLQRQLTGIAEVSSVPETQRVMRGILQPRKPQAVDLPYQFGIKLSSLPEGLTAFQDQYGIWYLQSDKEEPQEYEWHIAKLTSYSPNASLPSVSTRGTAALPQELLSLVQESESSRMPPIERVRAIVSSVRRGLKYSNSEQLSQLYRSDPTQFFTRIWEHKEADCDVANTLASEVLHQAGFKVRMVGGHSINTQTKEGSAVLHGGTRHAWLEVWDEESRNWIRLDATPAGDPNVDEEQQEEDLEPRPEGDYGEQDAELLSDDDLEKLRKEIEEAQKRREERSQDPVARYAEQAQCSLEEAKKVLEKIQTLRERHRGILEESRRVWHEAVKKNLTVQQVYSGPVPPDQGVDIDDDHIVEIPIAKRTHDPEPLAFTVPEEQEKVERSFGGYELYIGADRSGSMNDTDPVSGRRKKDAQRDAVFLFIDSVMQNVLEMRRAGKLKHAMPVRISVATFGKENEITLPLTEQWGPAEQVKLYRTLDDCAGGSTPDHLALQMLQEEIEQSPSLDDAKMHRAVLIFADGGSDDAQAVHDELERIRSKGIIAGGFGMTASGRAMEAVYAPDGRTIEHIDQLPDIGVRYVVNLLKEWYNIH